jgi:hypothetical protein
MSAHQDMVALTTTRVNLWDTVEGMDCKLLDLLEHEEAMGQWVEGVEVDVEVGRCLCGTFGGGSADFLTSSQRLVPSECGSVFDGFEVPGEVSDPLEVGGGLELDDDEV